MKLHKRMKFALSASIAAGLLSVAPATAQSPTNQLVMGQFQYLTNFHPKIHVNSGKRQVSSIGLWTISAYDDTQVVCKLCEELPTLDNGLAELVDNPDGTQGMRVTIRIREGMSWGDGVPVSSEDIRFTWELALNPNIGLNSWVPWERASDVEIVDERTVILTLDEPTLHFASWDHIIPAHIEKPIVEASPDLETYLRQTEYNRNPENPGLWNGPYMVTHYAAGSRILFERNPYFPGPGPHLDRIILSYRDNAAALYQNMLSGDLDAVVVSPGGISLAQMLEMREAYPDRFIYHAPPGTSLERIALNHDHPFLSDVRVRRALVHGIDRETILDALYQGMVTVAHSPLNELDPNYNEDVITRYEFDQDRARELLAEAGWTPGPDGICVNENGERLSLEFSAGAGNLTREQTILVMQNQLSEVCIEIVNNFMPANDFQTRMLRNRGLTLAMGSDSYAPTGTPRIWFGSDHIPSPENNYVGSNYPGYSRPEMDAAIQLAETGLTAEEQWEAWSEIQRYFSEDVVIIPLFHTLRAFVTVQGVTDFRPGTLDPYGMFANEWRRE